MALRLQEECEKIYEAIAKTKEKIKDLKEEIRTKANGVQVTQYKKSIQKAEKKLVELNEYVKSMESHKSRFSDQILSKEFNKKNYTPKIESIKNKQTIEGL